MSLLGIFGAIFKFLFLTLIFNEILPLCDYQLDRLQLTMTSVILPSVREAVAVYVAKRASGRENKSIILIIQKNNGWSLA